MNTKLLETSFKFNIGTVHFIPKKKGAYEFWCIDKKGQAITSGTSSKSNRSFAKDLIEEASIMEDTSNS